MMQDLDKAIQDELDYERESAEKQMKHARARLKRAYNMDIEEIKEAIEEGRQELDVGEDVDVDVDIYNNCNDLVFDKTERTYEEILEHDEAKISYNGNWLILDEVVELESGYTVCRTSEAKVPEDVKEILIACGKLVVRKTESLTSMC